MKNRHILFAIIVLAGILFLLIFSFIRDFNRLHQNGIFVRPNHANNYYQAGQIPANFSDINLIAGWMTFNYLNKAFNLPLTYLKTSLQISNAHYPNLTLAKLAKEQGVPIDAYLAIVKNTISNYFTQNIPPL